MRFRPLARKGPRVKEPFVGPRNAMEKQLAEIWAEELEWSGSAWKTISSTWAAIHCRPFQITFV